MDKPGRSDKSSRSRASRARAPKQLLTMRETQVVRLLSLGCSNHEIAAILGLATSTVDNFRSRAMAKLGVSKAATLTRVAILTGISGLRDQLTAAEKRSLRKK
jgi:DNA-binding NarL/FixJ family response regulator